MLRGPTAGALVRLAAPTVVVVTIQALVGRPVSWDCLEQKRWPEWRWCSPASPASRAARSRVAETDSCQARASSILQSTSYLFRQSFVLSTGC